MWVFVGGCGLVDDVFVEFDINVGFMKLLDGDLGFWGFLGLLGGVNLVGFMFNGVLEYMVVEVIVMKFN